MENMQKALIMAGSVFMFIIAISVAILSYNTVQGVIEQIMTASERNARAAEYFIEEVTDTERYATKAEVVMAIYSMQGIDYSADEILVAGKSFKKGDFSKPGGRKTIENAIKDISEGEYSLEYDFSTSGKTVLKYKKVVS